MEYYIDSYKDYNDHLLMCGVSLTDSSKSSVYANADKQSIAFIAPYAVNDNIFSTLCNRYILLKKDEECTLTSVNNEIGECEIDVSHELHYLGGKEMKTGINEARATEGYGLYYFTAEKDGYYNFKSYLGAIINPEIKFLHDIYDEDGINKSNRNINYSIKLKKGEDYVFQITAPHSENVALPFILDISYVSANPEK